MVHQSFQLPALTGPAGEVTPRKWSRANAEDSPLQKSSTKSLRYGKMHTRAGVLRLCQEKCTDTLCSAVSGYTNRRKDQCCTKRDWQVEEGISQEDSQSWWSEGLTGCFSTGKTRRRPPIKRESRPREREEASGRGGRRKGKGKRQEMQDDR